MVEEIIGIIKREIGNRSIQMFPTGNVVGDRMEILWVNPDDRSNYVAICWGWDYIDAVGFSDDDYAKIFEACGH